MTQQVFIAAAVSDPAARNRGPLGKLYSNEYQVPQYSYPENLASDATRRHIIQFTTLVPDPSYNQSADFTRAASKFLSGIKEAASAATTEQNTTNAGSTTFENQLENAKNNLLEAGGAILASSKDLFDVISSTDVKRKIGATVSLYVPDTVNVSYDATYNDMSLVGALGKPYFIAQAGASVLDTVGGAGKLEFSLDYVDKLINQAGTGAGNNPFVRSLLSKATGISEELLLSGIGQARNPQLQVIFSGIGFRKFQFDFTLTPRSKKEAEQIKEIVKFFKYASAPEIPTNGPFDKGIYFKVPDRFGIKFFYNGQENRNVHRITECVLENVNVDYAPMGWVTFDDGNPVQTRLTLQFQETEIIDKTRISDGY